MRPTRAEPIVRIAAFYINRNMYDLAFLYSYMACQIQYPNDILFVEKELYDRVRYEIFAKASLRSWRFRKKCVSKHVSGMPKKFHWKDLS